MSFPSNLRGRTKRIIDSLVEAAEDRRKRARYVKPVEIFPPIKYETCSLFTDRLDSNEQKEAYIERLRDVFHITQPRTTSGVISFREYVAGRSRNVDTSDVESTFDDSDKDKDFEPSSTDIDSESEIDDYPKAKVSLSSEKKRILSRNIKKISLVNLENRFNIAEEEHEVDSASEETDLKALAVVTHQDICTKTLKCFDKKDDENTECIPITTTQEAPNNEIGDIGTHNHILSKKRLTSAEKTEKDKNKHPFKEKCKGLCRRKCKELEEDTRRSIWNNYWSMNYTSRRKWLSKHVTLVPVKRKNTEARKSRAESRLFTLPKYPECTEVPVCRLTFLNTLGYNTDSVITKLVSAMEAETCGNAVKERRGINPKPKTDCNIIMEHIESFNPCISHYRRKNAPNIRYLPRELTIQYLFDNFISHHPDFCKIKMYRKMLKKINISLCKPKSDECEECSALENILQYTNQDGSSSSSQEQLDRHRLKASQANCIYKEDVQEAEFLTSGSLKRIYSMNLQKVILLPIMPQSKTCFFTSRLVIFNQTFATLNKDDSNKSFCVVWHKALSGRKAKSLVDAMMEVINKERDVKEFVFWCDNCSSQNKNWVLFTSLMSKVNFPTGPNKITIRYLTKGHTHMTADGIHGNIEKKIRRHRTAYDFEELLGIIASSRRKLEVLQLTEFHAWKNKKRTATKPDDALRGFLLKNVVEVCFIKGERTLYYKTDFKQVYQNLDFLQKKYVATTIPTILAERGINAEKKEKIIRELTPLMPENRTLFWKNLSESKESLDLVSKRDLQETNDND